MHFICQIPLRLIQILEMEHWFLFLKKIWLHHVNIFYEKVYMEKVHYLGNPKVKMCHDSSIKYP